MFFEVGSYKVHIYSWSVPYHDHRSAWPQFREVESRCSTNAQKIGYIFSTVEPLYPYELAQLLRDVSVSEIVKFSFYRT